MSGVDVVGDVHGNLDPLLRLLEELGYAEDGSHAAGRSLVFLGDLVDRGPRSLEVAELVMALTRSGRALCLMGNHEYNLVRWKRGEADPKHSNLDTVAQVGADPARWDPVLAWMATLPLSLLFPWARIIHAVWHPECAAAVSGPLGDNAFPVELRSPFSPDAALSWAPLTMSSDAPHEILIKGYERPVAQAFPDSEGVLRGAERVTWWSVESGWVQPRTIFGHYWNLPPMPEHPSLVPPYASGHPNLRSWQSRLAPSVPDEGRWPVTGAQKVCVDYNGVTLASDRACVGAYRWPEDEVAWACTPRRPR